MGVSRPKMTGNEMLVREMQADDADLLERVMYDAVHIGAAGAYSSEQRAAWLPAPPTGPAWRDRLFGQTCLVAEVEGVVLGFMTLSGDGLIDLAFVHPDHIGRGVAYALYQAVLEQAKAFKIPCLRTEASLMAKPFFTRQGWHVVKQQKVDCHGVQLTNFLMEFWLGAD